jgi:hypothetical protein
MNIENLDKHKKKKSTLITYSILGTVFSGDCDTTLANTIRMALYNRFVMDKAGYKYGKDYVAFSKGDDFTVMFNPTLITDEQVEHAYWQYFLHKPEAPYDQYDNRVFGIGQICKFLDFGNANTIKFCSLRAWYTNKQETKIRLTRDPSKFLNLSRYSRKMKSMNLESKILYLYSLADALDASYKGLTYFDTMAFCYRRRATQLKMKYNVSTKQLEDTKHKLERLTGDIRTTLSMDDHLDPSFTYDDTTPRQSYYEIGDNYWDTMQRIERHDTRKYTQEQLDICNSQIETEFDSNELMKLLA